MDDAKLNAIVDAVVKELLASKTASQPAPASVANVVPVLSGPVPDAAAANTMQSTMVPRTMTRPQSGFCGMKDSSRR